MCGSLESYLLLVALSCFAVFVWFIVCVLGIWVGKYCYDTNKVSLLLGSRGCISLFAYARLLLT